MGPGERIRVARNALRAATGAIAHGSGWTMSYRSAYTAHATYRLLRFTGHVIGTPDGRWWWAAQGEPGRVGSTTEAPDVVSACVAARRVARDLYNAHMREIRHGR